MSEILNLTQHPASDEQLEAGVIEPTDKEEVRNLLTFSEPPTSEQIRGRALALAEIASEHEVDAAMIGGAPYLMSALEGALRMEWVKPLFAFTHRETVEKETEDGVEKTSVFRHLGFVEGDFHSTALGYAEPHDWVPHCREAEAA